MLIDLLSPSNLGNFNIIIARAFGLHAAVYLSELMAISEKAIRKDKVEVIDNKPYFTVTRSYLTERTTLTKAEQLNLDQSLASCEIIEIKKGATNTLYLNMELLLGLFDVDLNATKNQVLDKAATIIKKKSKTEEKEARLAGQIANAKKVIKTTIPELRTAWYSWIEACANKYGFINNNIVTVNEEMVDKFANHNLDVALAVIHGNPSGYNTMKFSIEAYQKDHMQFPEMSFNLQPINPNINNEIKINTSEVY